MHARKSAETAKVTAVDPVAISHRAANDAGAHDAALVPQRSTLDVLVVQHGAPSPFARRIAFAGYDAAAGLVQGQQVASERILRAAPVFAQSVTAVWTAMTPARRELVVGFTPAMVTVLLGETVVLRDLDARYDRAAKLTTRSRARCEVLAKDALRKARDHRDQSVRLMRLHVSTAQQKELSLDSADEAAESPAALALTTDAAADAMAKWRASLPADELAYYATMGFTDGLVGALRACAAGVRSTQAELDAVSNVNRVTQRDLDEQDGRVLHLVGAIHLAFRLAAKRDPGVVVPELDELTSVFVRSTRASPRATATIPATPATTPA